MIYRDSEMASVEEVSDPFVVIVVGLRLRQFVVMVRELEVHSTSVNIHRGAEDRTGHNAALDVPTGATC